MATRSNHTAAPQVAGLILQVQRALHHLSEAGPDVSVAVELIDDVSLSRGGQPIAREQDKNSVRPGAVLLGDRSSALWRTLQIWIQDFRDSGGKFCERYFLVTNASTDGAVVGALKATCAKPDKAVTAVAAMRAAAKPRSASKVQAVIDDVLSEDDTVLEELAGRIEIVEGYDARAARAEIANGFGVDPGVDQESVLQALLGWLVESLQGLWQDRKPGIITKEACLRQCRELERRQARQRLLPRPPADVPVDESLRVGARARPFVDHLARIEAENDDVLQAIEHFIQFNIERARLAVDGDVPVQEWTDRGDRLKERWGNLKRAIPVEYRDRTRADQNRLLLIKTTYDHFEPLADHTCRELYMTSGHYHRLADDDGVWWDLDYSPDR